MQNAPRVRVLDAFRQSDEEPDCQLQRDRPFLFPKPLGQIGAIAVFHDQEADRVYRQGTQTIVVPADAADAFGKAFQMLKGRG